MASVECMMKVKCAKLTIRKCMSIQRERVAVENEVRSEERKEKGYVGRNDTVREVKKMQEQLVVYERWDY